MCVPSLRVGNRFINSNGNTALSEQRSAGIRLATAGRASESSVWDRRANNFDFLRLALAVLVIYSHSYPLGTGSEAHEPFVVATRGQLTGGAVAVNLFFVMSGFLIAASAERTRTVQGFLRKRFLRIYPAFLVCAFLTMLIAVPLSHAVLLRESFAGRLGDFILQTLRLTEFSYRDAFPANPYPGFINGSVWSIQYEFWCYLGVALLTMLGLLKRPMIVLSLFAVSIAVSLYLRAEHLVYGGKMLGILFGSPQLWARLLPLYLAGVCFHLFRRYIPLHAGLAAVAAAALALACLLPYGFVTIFPLAGTYLIFYLAYAPWIRLSSFGRYGDFSYGTYLYAFPVEQIVMQSLGHATSPWKLFWISMPLTLVCAALSWYGVERRFFQPMRQGVDAATIRPDPARRLPL